VIQASLRLGSEAIDDYLMAIFQIGGGNDRASTASLAKRPSVAPVSVTGMLKKLSEAERGRHPAEALR
jgi:Mn-dependent DtxR family transcriptional regulator